MALVDLNLERQAYISELAEDVWLNYSGERQVFLDSIANTVGISLSYGEYGVCFDGLLEHRNGCFHIYCNTAQNLSCNSPRARFSVAHELGHFFIDEHRNALLAGRSPHFSFPERAETELVEMEANLFAANLLMPTSEYRKATSEVSAGLAGIIDLASIFTVSIQSSALRWMTLSHRPCAIVMFRENASAWWKTSPELKTMGHQRIQKLSREEIPNDSATGLAFRDKHTPFGPVRKNGTLASAWFGGILNGSRRDEAFTESAVRLGSRGVLTLLEPCEQLLIP